MSEAVAAAVITARKPIPDSITTVAMNRPTESRGVTSPYPTVVTVWSANHRPLPIVGYSLWSSTLSRTPPTTVITTVNPAMIAAALRAVSESCSTRRAVSGTFAGLSPGSGSTT